MNRSDLLAEQHTRQRTIRHPSRIPLFPAARLRLLAPVLDEFEFRITPYYASLIDWADQDDPLAMIVLPHQDELTSDLDFDPSGEAANTRIVGLQHKYGPTALLLVTDVCAAYCRFCFRKRFTLATTHRATATATVTTDRTTAHAPPAKEVTLDIRSAVEYIRARPEITNVLLSGGDPLMLTPSRLARIIEPLRSIPHVRTIRIGSKLPAFDPDKVTQDLVDVLASMSGSDRRVYIATHFSHPRELTGAARGAIERLIAGGIILYNQTPLLRGVNDDPEVLVPLFQGLSDAGVAPYYLFQCRPVNGNERFTLTIQRGIDLVDQTRRRLGGLAKRFRYVASHTAGKIEIVGVNDGSIVFRYHQALDPNNDGRVFTWPAAQPISWPDAAVAAAAAAAATS